MGRGARARQGMREPGGTRGAAGSITQEIAHRGRVVRLARNLFHQRA